MAAPSPRSYATNARPIAIIAGTFASRLTPRPADGSYGSSAVGERTLGGIQQVLDFLQAGEACLRDQQPRPSVDRPWWQGRKPSLQRGALAAQEELVGVPLDQPRRPEGIPSGQRVAHGIVNRPMFLVPQAGVAMQLAHPVGILLLQSGAADRRTAGGSATSHARRPAAPGTGWLLSMASSICWPSARPVTASHSARQPVQH